MRSARSITISGKKLAKMRDSLAMSQEALARELDIAKNTVSRYENSPSAAIDMTVIRRLSIVFKRPVEKLRTELRAGSDKRPAAGPAITGVVAVNPKQITLETLLAGKSIGMNPRDDSLLMGIVDGDCMESAYPNGARVLFGKPSVGDGELLAGHDYLLQIKGKYIFRRIDDVAYDRVGMRVLNKDYMGEAVELAKVSQALRAIWVMKYC